MRFCIVYLASPKSHHIFNDPEQESRLELIRGSLRITRKHFPTTDIFVFHEDYEDEQFALLPGVTEFIRVDFSGQEEFCTKSLRRPYGYLMMCRFFSGIMQSHPRVREYTHYMRLDDDSYFQTPYLTEEYVKTHLLKHDYVFRSVFQDTQDQASLFAFTLDFLRKEGYAPYIDTLKQELRKKYLLQGDTYTGLAPYNNFHIASQRLWQTPLVQRYIAAIEESHGILQNGWMDANIHAMVVYVLALFCGMKIHHDATFGYRHNRHVSRMDSTGIHYEKSLPFASGE
jgi:hypothetical protein